MGRQLILISLKTEIGPEIFLDLGSMVVMLKGGVQGSAKFLFLGCENVAGKDGHKR